jgi:hypothetical protein
VNFFKRIFRLAFGGVTDSLVDALTYPDPDKQASSGIDRGACPGNRGYCEWVLNPSNTAKRNCTKCGAEDWVFSNPYPGIGEVAMYWKRMFEREDR